MTKNNILLSIKPEYAKKIYSGEKRYEFRKQKPKQSVIIAYIYETRPIKKITGWFEVKEILMSTPKVIWNYYKNSSGITEKEYFEYVGGAQIIYAFEIGDVYEFGHPINPFIKFLNFKAPRNFEYLGRGL